MSSIFLWDLCSLVDFSNIYNIRHTKPAAIFSALEHKSDSGYISCRNIHFDPFCEYNFVEYRELIYYI